MTNRDFVHEIVQPTENLDVNFKVFNDNGSYISSHWHNSIEIIYITSGSLNLYIGNRTYHLKTNDCFLINSGVVHSTHCVDRNTSILLQIPLSFLNRYIPDFKTNYFDFDINTTDANYERNLNQIKKLLLNMKSLKISSSKAGHLRFTSLLFELLFQLYNNFRFPINNNINIKSTMALSKFEPVLEYTKLNYNRTISISEIAKFAHLQPEYFCRKFKQYMGQTYLEYLNEIRLAHIYKDLLNTNDSLCSILEAHGFTNNKLFYKIFKEKFNCTPKEVRKVNIEGDTYE